MHMSFERSNCHLQPMHRIHISDCEFWCCYCEGRGTLVVFESSITADMCQVCLHATPVVLPCHDSYFFCWLASTTWYWLGQLLTKHVLTNKLFVPAFKLAMLLMS